MAVRSRGDGREAVEKMIRRAGELGANAVVSFKLDSNELSEFMDEIVAYGTAVFVEPGPTTISAE